MFEIIVNLVPLNKKKSRSICKNMCILKTFGILFVILRKKFMSYLVIKGIILKKIKKRAITSEHYGYK